MRLLHGWALLHCQLDSAGHVLRAAGSASKRESLALPRSRPSVRSHTRRARPPPQARPASGSARASWPPGREPRNARIARDVAARRQPRSPSRPPSRASRAQQATGRAVQDACRMSYAGLGAHPVAKGSRRRTCAGDQRDRQTLTSAEDANRARVPRVKARQRRLDLHSLRQVRTPSSHPVDPSPAGTKSTVNNVMTGNS